MFLYHSPGSKYGKRLAGQLKRTFTAKYDRHQPNRGFNGTVSSRNLFVLRSSTPYAVFLELGYFQNARDQQRLVLTVVRHQPTGLLRLWLAIIRKSK